MLIDDRAYTTGVSFLSGPKNVEAVASSCLNVVTALAAGESVSVHVAASIPRCPLVSEYMPFWRRLFLVINVQI